MLLVPLLPEWVEFLPKSNKVALPVQCTVNYISNLRTSDCSTCIKFLRILDAGYA